MLALARAAGNDGVDVDADREARMVLIIWTAVAPPSQWPIMPTCYRPRRPVNGDVGSRRFIR